MHEPNLTGVDAYLRAADRENTVRSYAAAIRHFELEWKGLLPATADTVARYLAEHAEIYRVRATLIKSRLAGWSGGGAAAAPR